MHGVNIKTTKDKRLFTHSVCQAVHTNCLPGCSHTVSVRLFTQNVCQALHTVCARLFTQSVCQAVHTKCLPGCSHKVSARLFTQSVCQAVHTKCLRGCSHKVSARLFTQSVCQAVQTKRLLCCSHKVSARLFTQIVCQAVHTKCLLGCSHKMSARLFTQSVCQAVHTKCLLLSSRFKHTWNVTTTFRSTFDYQITSDLTSFHAVWRMCSCGSCVVPSQQHDIRSASCFQIHFNIILTSTSLNIVLFSSVSCCISKRQLLGSAGVSWCVAYSDTSANEDNSFRNHIRQPKSSLAET